MPQRLRPWITTAYRAGSSSAVRADFTTAAAVQLDGSVLPDTAARLCCSWLAAARALVRRALHWWVTRDTLEPAARTAATRTVVERQGAAADPHRPRLRSGTNDNTPPPGA